MVKFNKFYLVMTLIVLSMILKGSACKDTSTTPADNNPSQLKWTNLGTKTLDASGGDAEFDNIKISIPQGNLSKPTNLVFSKSTNSWINSEDAVSDIYSVKFENSSENEMEFTVKLTAKENLESLDGIALMLAYEVNDEIMGNKGYNFLPIDDIQIKGNVVTATIKAKIVSSYKTFMKKNVEPQVSPVVLLPPALIFQVLKSYYNKTSVEGNFKVYGHYALTDPPDEMLKTLEIVRTKLGDLGFDLKRWRDTKIWPWWPFRCYIYPSNTWVIGMSNNEYAFFRPNWISRNLDYLAINAKYIKGSNTLKVNLGHEFFHAIQSTYNHEQTTAYRWIMEASSAWFETIVSDRQWTPLTYRNSTQFYKDGIEGVTAKDKANHGYPSFILLKYLSDKFDNKIISDIWKEIDTQSFDERYNAARAIAMTVENTYKKPFNEEYSNFIHDFVQGKINSFSLDNIELLTQKEWSVSKADIIGGKEFKTSVDYPDLSAQMFLVNFNADLKDLTVDAPFTMKFNPADKNAIAYILNNDDTRTDIAVINPDKPEFVIDKVKDYAGKSIMVVIVNTNHNTDYSGTTNISFVKQDANFEMRIISNKGELPPSIDEADFVIPNTARYGQNLHIEAKWGKDVTTYPDGMYSVIAGFVDNDIDFWTLGSFSEQIYKSPASTQHYFRLDVPIPAKDAKARKFLKLQMSVKASMSDGRYFLQGRIYKIPILP